MTKIILSAKVNDTSGLLKGDYADGRNLARLYNLTEVKLKEKALRKITRTRLKLLDK